MERSGVLSGVLLFIVGLWLVLRTTHRDDSHRTLINHILGTYPEGYGPTGRLR